MYVLKSDKCFSIIAFPLNSQIPSQPNLVNKYRRKEPTIHHSSRRRRGPLGDRRGTKGHTSISNLMVMSWDDETVSGLCFISGFMVHVHLPSPWGVWTVTRTNLFLRPRTLIIFFFSPLFTRLTFFFAMLLLFKCANVICTLV